MLLSDYRIIRTARRTLELRVLPGGDIEVRAPWSASDRAVNDFVASRQQWLKKNLSRLQQQTQPLQSDYRTGSLHPFLGQALQLQLIKGKPGNINQQNHHLLVSPGKPASQQPVALIERWYRQQAHYHFSQEIRRQFPFFAQRGHALPTLRIKRMKSRWGSLSSRGYINLNLMLIGYPSTCLAYVVCHELCHLEHANHGPGFIALMNQRMPDWQARKQLLNQLPVITALQP